MGNPIRLSPDFSGKTWHARREWHNIFKVMKGKKIYNIDYSNWQGFHSGLMERSKVLQTRKTKRVQQHQTIFVRNVNGISLSKKEKGTTRNMKIIKEKISVAVANSQYR